MQRLVLLLFLATTSLMSGCKSSVVAEYIQKGKASLRLFEESTGSLFDLKNGSYALEIDQSSLNPLNDSLILRLKSEGHSYVVRVDKAKIKSDGTFELNETELEQPIRITGRVKTDHEPVKLLALLSTSKILSIEIKIFKGFSNDEEPIGLLTANLETNDLKQSEFLTKNAAL